MNRPVIPSPHLSRRQLLSQCGMGFGAVGLMALLGNAGHDTLLGGAGFDRADGSRGRDRCVAERETRCER